ncbi:MAG TPA: adenylyltransferase/cytidyltransferase family protein [Candidatus Eisenbacteria bacterium]|nr:adenylyltransferase/cytidyltransferase family protein [Candidatus Eisenbacteria bacterium]
MAKIVNIEEVEKLSKQFHSLGKTIVVAGGCFDILHSGHITLLENAKKEGDVLFVLLESDSAIKKRKGIHRPIHTQHERAHMISRLQDVDVVVVLPDTMTDSDYDTLIRAIHPTVIATTENDTHITHKERQAQLVGARVKQVNKYLPAVSTTKLLDVLSKEL